MNGEAGQRTVGYHEFSTLKQDITDMKSLMRSMVEAMGRITVIEERQHALGQSTSKAIERMEIITERQHAHEVASAGNAAMAAQVTSLETKTTDLNLENERNKARFITVIWMVRGLWAVVGTSGLAWLLHGFIGIPPIR